MFTQNDNLNKKKIKNIKKESIEILFKKNFKRKLKKICFFFFRRKMMPQTKMNII